MPVVFTFSQEEIEAMCKRAREAGRREGRMTLFNHGEFTLHSGDKSNFKIDCDALTDKDIESLVSTIVERYDFSSVYGVPRGGVRLAKCLEKHCTHGPRLVVDDVLTTGNSMEEVRQDGDIGVVIFARSECPDWVTPIFQMGEHK